MNEIHETAIIGSNVILGDGNKILPYTIIYDGVKIGNANIIGPHAVIGSPATDSKNTDREIPKYNVTIGDANIIREFCVVEQSCYEDITAIKNDVFLMQGVHLSHDNIIENKVVITNLSVVAGIVKILEGANIGMACTINQYTIIGQYSITATNSAVMKNVRPFSRYIPNKPISVNEYAVKKFGFENYSDEIRAYVLEDKMVTSPILVNIVDEFNYWVSKYGNRTY